MINEASRELIQEICTRRMINLDASVNVEVIRFLCTIRESINMARMLETEELKALWDNHIAKHEEVTRFVLEGAGEFFTLMGYGRADIMREGVRLSETYSYNYATSEHAVMPKEVMEEIEASKGAAAILCANPWVIWVFAISMVSIPAISRK